MVVVATDMKKSENLLTICIIHYNYVLLYYIHHVPIWYFYWTMSVRLVIRTLGVQVFCCRSFCTDDIYLGTIMILLQYYEYYIHSTASSPSLEAPCEWEVVLKRSYIIYIYIYYRPESASICAFGRRGGGLMQQDKLSQTYFLHETVSYTI